MATKWRSPYRDGPQPATSRLRAWVSHAVLVIVGGLLVYLGVGGMRRLRAAYAAAPSPWWTTYNHHLRFDGYRLILWLLVVGVALLGLTMIIAGLMSAGRMQSLVERGNRPPITGERGLDSRWRWWRRRPWDGWPW